MDPSILKFAQALNMVQPFSVNISMIFLNSGMTENQRREAGGEEAIYEETENASSIKLSQSYFSQR